MIGNLAFKKKKQKEKEKEKKSIPNRVEQGARLVAVQRRQHCAKNRS